MKRREKRERGKIHLSNTSTKQWCVTKELVKGLFNLGIISFGAAAAVISRRAFTRIFLSAFTNSSGTIQKSNEEKMVRRRKPFANVSKKN